MAPGDEASSGLPRTSSRAYLEHVRAAPADQVVISRVASVHTTAFVERTGHGTKPRSPDRSRGRRGGAGPGVRTGRHRDGQGDSFRGIRSKASGRHSRRNPPWPGGRCPAPRRRPGWFLPAAFPRGSAALRQATSRPRPGVGFGTSRAVAPAAGWVGRVAASISPGVGRWFPVRRAGRRGADRTGRRRGRQQPAGDGSEGHVLRSAGKHASAPAAMRRSCDPEDSGEKPR